MTAITAEKNNILLPAEKAALNGYEKIIENGIEAFAAAGRAMLAIHDQRLYRATHATFAAYCSERWGMSDRHVRRLMLAADVVTKMQEVVGPIGPLPTTESQARELVGLEPSVAVEVMHEVASGGRPVTAKGIKAARVRRQHAPVDTAALKIGRAPLSDVMRNTLVDLESLARRVARVRDSDRFSAYREHFEIEYLEQIDSLIGEMVLLRNAVAQPVEQMVVTVSAPSQEVLL